MVWLPTRWCVTTFAALRIVANRTCCTDSVTAAFLPDAKMQVGPCGASVCLTDRPRITDASCVVTSLHGLLAAPAAARLAAVAICPEVFLCLDSLVGPWLSGCPTGLTGLCVVRL